MKNVFPSVLKKSLLGGHKKISQNLVGAKLTTLSSLPEKKYFLFIYGNTIIISIIIITNE